MTLQNVLMNDIIYYNIINNLPNDSRILLSAICKTINTIMNTKGFSNTLTFKFSNLEDYTQSLHLYDLHKRYLKFVIVENETDIFSYLPKYEEKKTVILKNCKLNISNQGHINRLEKMQLKSCTMNNITNIYKK